MSDPGRRSLISSNTTQSTSNLHYQPQHPRSRAPFDQYSSRDTPSGSAALDRMNNQSRHPLTSIARPRSSLNTPDRRNFPLETESAPERKSRFTPSRRPRSSAVTPTSASPYLHPDSAASTPSLPTFSRLTGNRTSTTQNSPLSHDIWEEAGSDATSNISKKSSTRSFLDRIKRRPKDLASSLSRRTTTLSRPLSRAASLNLNSNLEADSQHRAKSSVELKEMWAARRAKSGSLNSNSTPVKQTLSPSLLKPTPSPLGSEAEFEYIQPKRNAVTPVEILERAQARARVSMEVPREAVYSPVGEGDTWLSESMSDGDTPKLLSSPLPVLAGGFPETPEARRAAANFGEQTSSPGQQRLSLMSPTVELVNVDPTPATNFGEDTELSPEPPSHDAETTAITNVSPPSMNISPVSTPPGSKSKPSQKKKKKTTKKQRSFTSAYLTTSLLLLLGANISFVVEHWGSGAGHDHLCKMGIAFLEAVVLCLSVYLFGERAIKFLKKKELGNPKKQLRGP